MEEPLPSRESFFDRLKGRSPLFWVFVLLLVGLNFWFDYYHPLGAVFDVVIVIALAISHSGPRSANG